MEADLVAVRDAIASSVDPGTDADVVERVAVAVSHALEERRRARFDARRRIAASVRSDWLRVTVTRRIVYEGPRNWIATTLYGSIRGSVVCGVGRAVSAPTPITVSAERVS